MLFCLNKVQFPQWHEPKMLFVGFCSPCCIICGCILAWLEVEWLNSHTKLLQAADRIKPFTEMEGSMRDMIRKLKAYDWAMRSAEAKETADAALKDMDLLLDLLEAMGGELSIFRYNYIIPH